MSKSNTFVKLNIELIDKKINEHRLSIIDLQRTRNSLLPIASLPPEILGEIFVSTLLSEVLSDYSYPSGRDYIGDPAHWFNVTLVCHHWRTIAINTPRLWSYWGSASPHWCRTLHERSKSAPLNIRVTLSHGKKILPLTQLLGKTEVQARVRELHVLTGTRACLRGVLDSFFSRDPSPRLSIESLRIEHMAIGGLEPDPSLPNALKLAELPLLSHLELHGCNFNWDSLVVSSSMLTSLKISRNTVLPSIPNMLEVLRQNNSLVSLHLDLTILNDSPDVPLDVALPYLRSIRITGSRDICLLMRHMRYPAASAIVSISIHSNIYVTNLEVEPDIVGLLSSHYQSRPTINTHNGSDTLGIQQLDISSTGSKHRIECWGSIPYIDDTSPFVPPPGYLKIEWVSRKYSEVLTKILCDILPLSKLSNLHTEGIELSTDEWSKVFARLVRLEVLEVQGNFGLFPLVLAMAPKKGGKPETNNQLLKKIDVSMKDSSRLVESAISGSQPGTVGNVALHVPLLRLERLGLSYVDFGACDSTAGKIFYRALRSCLEQRKTAGHQLATLALRACMRLTVEDVESYMEIDIAKEVDWDQQEDLDEDEDDEEYSDSEVQFYDEEDGE